MDGGGSPRRGGPAADSWADRWNDRRIGFPESRTRTHHPPRGRDDARARRTRPALRLTSVIRDPGVHTTPSRRAPAREMTEVC